jgi:hypothetical protein
MDYNTEKSSYREKLIEHLFVGELLRRLWQKGIYDVEFIHPEVDQSGYDLVVDCNSIFRHIQLKSSHQDAKVQNQKINIQLSKKPSGCVVWIQFNPKTLELGPYLWYGSEPGKPLYGIEQLPVAKQTRGNSTGYKAERQNIHILKKKEFQKIPNIDELLKKLFGIIDSSVQNDVSKNGLQEKTKC